jgi:2-phospho-L-lactate guanylyltransferase
MRRADWVAVVPVKRLAAAKSRLRGAVDDSRHEELALAMVADTVTAVLACTEVDEVLVVTDDPVVTAIVSGLGARVVPDVPGAGLNAAVGFGADVAAGTGRWRAVLAGDLPGLDPEHLGEALRAARAVRVRHFLPDAAGTGTVLLTAPAGVPLDPRFGPGSAAAHAASGASDLRAAVELSGDWAGLRRDVDTAADLWAVMALGAGSHTAGLLGDLHLTANFCAG